MFDLMPYEQKDSRLFKYLDDFERNFLDPFNRSGVAQFRTDIIDKEDRYILQAELPGFKKEEIQIELNDKYLTIHAEHKEEIKKEEDNFVKHERRWGSFSRSFDVSDIDTDKIKAQYKDGILEMEMPKAEEKLPESKRIEIQ